MLIGCMGAGGTGKTTLAKALAEQIKLPFIASSSRPVFERRGITEVDQRHMTPEQQWELQLEIFDARERLENQIAEGTLYPDGGVADRTLWDQLAYSLLRAHGVMAEEHYLSLALRAQLACKKYDVLFYFPLHTFPGGEDGFRDTAHGSRMVFDAILQRLIWYHEAHRVMTMLPGSVEERAAGAKAYIMRLMISKGEGHAVG